MPPRILPGKTLDPTQSTISVVMNPSKLTSFSVLHLLLLTLNLQDVMFTTVNGTTLSWQSRGDSWSQVSCISPRHNLQDVMFTTVNGTTLS